MHQLVLRDILWDIEKRQTIGLSTMALRVLEWSRKRGSGFRYFDVNTFAVSVHRIKEEILDFETTAILVLFSQNKDFATWLLIISLSQWLCSYNRG